MVRGFRIKLSSYYSDKHSLGKSALLTFQGYRFDKDDALGLKFAYTQSEHPPVHDLSSGKMPNVPLNPSNPVSASLPDANVL